MHRHPMYFILGAMGAVFVLASRAAGAEAEARDADPMEPRFIVQEEPEVDLGTNPPPRGFRGRAPGDHRPPHARPGGPPGSPGAGSWSGPDGRRPIDRLMEHLKATAPERHERLVELRDTDPELFRQELRTLFEEAARRMNSGRGDGWRPEPPRRPDGETGPRSQPPGEERAFRRPGSPEDSARGDGRKPERPRHAHRADGQAPGAGGVPDERLERVKKWAAEYFAADGAEKEAVRKRIREAVADLHDARERERLQRIERMESELLILKEEMNWRRNNAESLVDKAVDDILSRTP